jgi:hypothetical protein
VACTLARDARSQGAGWKTIFHPGHIVWHGVEGIPFEAFFPFWKSRFVEWLQRDMTQSCEGKWKVILIDYCGCGKLFSHLSAMW